ncbi:hypothetical protein Tsubulata_007566 [Turnera subulata]|uniref:Protein transport protein SEC23 n=1 Tax=Turnera subulata TaxID=218843 RepID=A0A9Q0F1M9_9ROSI|nr:hypothetical protein Tsubulata_007566 [Turnera subulata]
MVGGKKSTKGKDPIKEHPTKRRSSSTSSHQYPVEGSNIWFTSRPQLSPYLTFFAKRSIASPRYLPDEYPQEKQYTNLPRLLQESHLWEFVTRRRHEFNADFIRAFYSTLTREGDVLSAQVNGKTIQITLEQFGTVAKLPFQGHDLSGYGGDHFLTNYEIPLLAELGFKEVKKNRSGEKRSDLGTVATPVWSYSGVELGTADGGVVWLQQRWREGGVAVRRSEARLEVEEGKRDRGKQQQERGQAEDLGVADLSCSDGGEERGCNEGGGGRGRRRGREEEEDWGGGDGGQWWFRVCHQPSSQQTQKPQTHTNTLNPNPQAKMEIEMKGKAIAKTDAATSGDGGAASRVESGGRAAASRSSGVAGRKDRIRPICFHRNHFPPHHAASISPDTLPPELFPQYTTIEYQQDDASSPSPLTCLFVVDTYHLEEEIGFLRSTLSQAMHLIPDTSLVGLITFGSFVQVHKLGFPTSPRPTSSTAPRNTP